MSFALSAFLLFRNHDLSFLIVIAPKFTAGRSDQDYEKAFD